MNKNTGINNFIKENKKFWSQFRPKNNGKKLLIEEPNHPGIAHANAIFARIINQAKGYVPVWLYESHFQSEEFGLFRSFFPKAKIMKPPKKTNFQRLQIGIIARLKLFKIYLTRNILDFHYDGVRYGDILYDSYLRKNKIATIRKINYKTMKRLIAFCIFRHIIIKNILHNDNYAGVLVSHQVGIRSGVMLRCALRYGYKGYLRSGRYHEPSFQCYKTLNDVYNHPHKASTIDINRIIRLGSKFEKLFLEIFKKQVSGKGSWDALNAFSKNFIYYTNRTSFNKDYKLNPSKKNVFIMLHAFNDHPHSHFRWMLFKDYYDWFVQTLEFAKKNNRVNWIFKQHPSIKWYTVKDVKFKDLFYKLPKNIVYIDEERQIDTRSLIHCADVVITCQGSAGFELPAVNAIPSITAADNKYAGLGFAIEPKTKKEYFEILKRVDTIKKLSPHQQKRGQAAYTYIYQLSRVSLSTCPNLSISQDRDDNIKSWYWKKAAKLYQERRNTFLKEVKNYIQEIAQPNFKQLTKKF